MHMDTPKAKVLLKKIQNLFDAIAEAPGEPSKIERDLLRDYTRQFYECLYMTPGANGSAHNPSVAGAEMTPDIPPAQPATASKKSTPESPGSPKKPDQDSIPDPSMPPHVAAVAVTTSVQDQPVLQETKDEPPVAAVVQEHVEHTRVQIENVKTSRTTVLSGETSALFNMEEARELSDKLRLRKIDDLSRSMGINERFLTINELFGGNHEEFDRVLRDLNSLGSFDEARQYLENNVIGSYNWLEEKRQKKAGVFIQLVRRRFIEN